MDFKKSVSLVMVGLALAVNTNAQSFLTNGLVAYYPFNGSAADASGYGNNGTVYGAVLTTDRFGKTNSAYSFNGTNNYIQTTGKFAVGANAKSFSVWLNPSLLKRGWIIDGGGDGFSGQSFGLFMESSNGKILFHGQNSFYDLEIFTIQQLQRWQHLCVTYDGAVLQSFVNGQLVSSKSATLNTGNLDVKIGSRQNAIIELTPTDAYFVGIIDDVRIYSRALSTNEVAQLYTIESPEVLNVKRAVYLDSQNLKLGTNYQVQVSGNLTNWTNYGSAFTATTNTWRTTNYWDVDNWSQLYFRLQKQ